jgi:hypothetical protein
MPARAPFSAIYRRAAVLPLRRTVSRHFQQALFAYPAGQRAKQCKAHQPVSTLMQLVRN